MRATPRTMQVALQLAAATRKPVTPGVMTVAPISRTKPGRAARRGVLLRWQVRAACPVGQLVKCRWPAAAACRGQARAAVRVPVQVVRVRVAAEPAEHRAKVAKVAQAVSR